MRMGNTAVAVWAARVAGPGKRETRSYMVGSTSEIQHEASPGKRETRSPSIPGAHGINSKGSAHNRARQDRNGWRPVGEPGAHTRATRHTPEPVTVTRRGTTADTASGARAHTPGPARTRHAHDRHTCGVRAHTRRFYHITPLSSMFVLKQAQGTAEPPEGKKQQSVGKAH